MLKTNSKKAYENLKEYIRENLGGEGYEDRPDESAAFPEIARFILKAFRREKYSTIEDYRYYGGSERRAFEDWCAGLPSVLDTCYFYNRSAVKDLGDLLEETEEERNKHDESTAEKCLTYLLYCVLTNEEGKQ